MVIIMSKLCTIIFSLFFLCCLNCYPQSIPNNSKKIAEGTASFLNTSKTEKAYLQFDKPYYAAGDTIYFKAYLTSGEQHQLSNLSGLLHVDLINTHNSIDQSIKLQLDSGITWGDFALPDSLPAGNYRVRAYTQWMRNNVDMAFFEKTITIGSAAAIQKTNSSKYQPSAPLLKPDIQFFPEGGELVAGIQSKVAFKSVDGNGLGVDIKGAIVDNNDREVTTFQSAHLGMGYFYLTPENGKNYQAKIIYQNGQIGLFDLPKPQPAGLTLAVNNDSLPKASVLLSANAEFYRQNSHKNYVLVIYSGGIITTVNCKLDSPVIKLDIFKRKLHTGVATITLFSAENEPLCERLLFIQNYDRLNLELNTDKKNYGKREKVIIRLNAANRTGSAAHGNFSASVIDESKVPEVEKDGDNMLSYFLLTSDLKGYVEQPAYYFVDTDQSVGKNLDILMLTQGYRRFTWKEVLDSTAKPLARQPEKGIEITGQVKNLFNKPVANGLVTLIPPKGGALSTALTDKDGLFRFSNLIFTDTMHFVLSAVNSKNKNDTKINVFNNNNQPAVIPIFQSNQTFKDSLSGVFLKNERLQQQELLNNGIGRGTMLKQVNIREKKLDDQYTTESLAGAGHADQVMHAEELERIEGPLAISLDGRLRGVTFVGNGSFRTPYLTLSLMSSMGASAPKKMLVVIDGAEVDANDINYLTAADVETVEVLKYASASIYGVEGAGGVLVITTKQSRGIKAKDIGSTGILPIAVAGFYKAREFYSPKYDANNLLTKQKDLRSTIYWQPELKTDKNGNAAFEFYNADGTGTYKVTIEGIDKDGNIGRQVYRYRVE